MHDLQRGRWSGLELPKCSDANDRQCREEHTYNHRPGHRFHVASPVSAVRSCAVCSSLWCSPTTPGNARVAVAQLRRLRRALTFPKGRPKLKAGIGRGSSGKGTSKRREQGRPGRRTVAPEAPSACRDSSLQRRAARKTALGADRTRGAQRAPATRGARVEAMTYVPSRMGGLLSPC